MKNLNLSTEQVDAYEQKVSELKKPSIENGSLLRLLFIGLDHTKSAKKRATESQRELTLKDGLGMEFTTLGYWKGKDYITTVDYSNPNNVKFPVAGLMLKAHYYLNVGGLKMAGYLEPKDDNEALLLYRQLLERDLSIPHAIELKEGLIINAFRYMRKYYNKDQYEDPTTKKVLKKDAKQDTSWNLSTTVPIIKRDEDGKVVSVDFSKDKIDQNIEQLDDATLEKVYDAIVANEISTQGDEPTPF